MAFTCLRSLNQKSLSSFHSLVKNCAAPAPWRASAPAGSSSQATRFSRAGSHLSNGARRLLSSSRCPSELGCCWGSLFPLHSAVAMARLVSCLSSTSRSCRALSHDGIDGT